MKDYLRSIIRNMLLDENDTYSYMLTFHNNNVIYNNVLADHIMVKTVNEDGDEFSYYQDRTGYISPCGMYLRREEFTIPIKDVMEIFYIDSLMGFSDEYSRNKIVLDRAYGMNQLSFGVIGEMLTFDYPSYASLWRMDNNTKELLYINTSPIVYDFNDKNYPPEGFDVPGVITLFDTEIITYL